MQPTQTGIATALALAVVAVFFLFPGLSPIRLNASSMTGAAAESTNPTQKTTATIMADATELQITDITVGSGAAAQAGDVVTVNYVGSLTNGSVFDASANHGSQGFTFNLGAGQVIKGWDQGVAGMKEGGKRTLVIPASLAYGSQAIGNIIPANSTLIFEVELLKVQKGGN